MRNPRNRAIALVVVCLVVVSAILYGIISFIDSRIAVAVTYPSGVSSVVFTAEQQEVGGVNQSGKRVKLEPGEYEYVLKGDNIDSSARKYTVDENSKQLDITYAPYSEEYLQQLYQADETGYRQLIQDEVLDGVDGYEQSEARLLDRGQILAVTVVPEDFDAANPVNVYRSVFVQSGDTWKQIGSPELYRSVFNTPDVSVEILRRINDIQ